MSTNICSHPLIHQCLANLNILDDFCQVNHSTIRETFAITSISMVVETVAFMAVFCGWAGFPCLISFADAIFILIETLFFVGTIVAAGILRNS